MGSRIWQQIEDFKEVENTVEVITGQNTGYWINESVEFFRPYRTDSNESDPYRYGPRKRLRFKHRFQPSFGFQ
jgi:hypothetical protein